MGVSKAKLSEHLGGFQFGGKMKETGILRSNEGFDCLVERW